MSQSPDALAGVVARVTEALREAQKHGRGTFDAMEPYEAVVAASIADEDIAALLAALAEAQKDKERLNWFDRIWKDDDTTSLDKAWQSSTPGPAGSGRAGIDAARAGEKAVVDILSDDWWDREMQREA